VTSADRQRLRRASASVELGRRLNAGCRLWEFTREAQIEAPLLMMCWQAGLGGGLPGRGSSEGVVGGAGRAR